MALTVCPAIQKHVLFKPTAIKSRSLGHHAQMDVKFLSPLTFKGKKIRRFQYTAIDDSTRIRALKIYHKHTPNKMPSISLIMFPQSSPSVFKPYEPIMAMHFRPNSTGRGKIWGFGTFISNLFHYKCNHF
jgi:hypothetical protein